MNIMVVDDEPQFRLLMRSFLSRPDWTIFLSENGEEALQKMTQIGMDLIISDVYMPVMDGIKLHRTIREVPGYERVPFLFISGYDDQYTLGAVKDPRIDGFYKKGRPTEELKQWIAYLTAPEDSRPKTPPGQTIKPKFVARTRDDRGRGGTSTPIL